MKKILVLMLILCMSVPVMSACGGGEEVWEKSVTEFYDTMYENVKALAEAIDNKDEGKIDKVKADAESYLDKYWQSERELEDEYQEMINDLRDKYGDDLVNEALTVFNEAAMEANQEAWGE